MGTELLDIVNEQDEVIRQVTRAVCHRDRLLHRIVHVHLYNDKGDILFQRRGMNVDMFPGMLDASVGGHVISGKDYQEMALQELEEETGIVCSPNELADLGKFCVDAFDRSNGTNHPAFAQEYAYRFNGDPEHLKTEGPDKTAGFIWMPYLELIALSPEQQRAYIRIMFEPHMLNVFRQIYELRTI